jgi:hypothetical protein
MVFAAGETWTSLDTTSLTVAGNGLAYGNGSFVATNCSGGTGNEFLRSSNGTTWTMSGAVADICMTSVAYGAGKFVATSRYDRNIHVSSDGGASWTVIDPGEPNRAEWTSITYGGGQFIAVSFFPGRKILRSTDAVTWTAIDADAASSATDGTQWRDVAYGNNRFVGISHFSRSLVSTDGLTWSLTQSLPVSAYDIAFGNGVFVAVSTAGVNRIMTSADGVTWSVPSVSSAIATTAWSDVTWDPGGSQFVAVGNGSVMTSPDGTTWTMGVAASGNSWQTVIAGASMLVSMSSNEQSHNDSRDVFLRIPDDHDGCSHDDNCGADDHDHSSRQHNHGRLVHNNDSRSHNHCCRSASSDHHGRAKPGRCTGGFCERRFDG